MCPPEDLTRFIKKGKEAGKQSIFENDVHWARFYLAKAGLIGSQKRGLWGLTPEGRGAQLTREDAEALCVRIRAGSRQDPSVDEETCRAGSGRGLGASAV
jgi:5-methylcytosine-specific restriction protein B